MIEHEAKPREGSDRPSRGGKLTLPHEKIEGKPRLGKPEEAAKDCGAGKPVLIGLVMRGVADSHQQLAPGAAAEFGNCPAHRHHKVDPADDTGDHG